MSNQRALNASTDAQNLTASARIWQQRALAAGHEAGLASRLLRRLIVTSTDQTPSTTPLPILRPASIVASDEVVSNIESIERSAKFITVTGWAFLRKSPDCRLTRTSCIISAGENWYCIPITTIHRPDVAAVFPTPDSAEVNRAYSGFVVRFECENFRSAPFQGRLIMQERSSEPCSSISFDLPLHL